MKHFFTVLTCLLLTSFAWAQTSPIPPVGYIYKVEAAIPGKEVYISSQRPYNANGDLVGAGNVEAQTQQVFENLKIALGSVGMTLNNITQVTYHIKGEPGQVNPFVSKQASTVGASYFTSRAPQLSETKSIATIGRDDVLVEVEVIAVK